MSEQTLSKGEWIDEVYRLLCKSQGDPANEAEEQNLRAWAASLADDETAMYSEGFTPEEAHDEELSNA